MVKNRDLENRSGIIGLGILPMRNVEPISVVNKLRTEGRVVDIPNVNALKNSFISGLGFFGGAKLVDRIYDAFMRLRV